MKKCISIILIIAVIFSVTYTCVYASEEEEETFFELNSEEASQGEILELIIDLSKIEYDNFTFELTSNYSLDDVETSEEDIEISEDNTSNEEDEENEKDLYAIQMQIDKTNLENIDTIILYYTIPDSIEIGETITFTATVTNSNDEEQTETVEREVTIVEVSEEDNSDSNKSESQNNTQSEKSDTQTQGQTLDSNSANSQDMNTQDMSSQMESNQKMSSQTLNGEDANSMSSEKTTISGQSESEESQVTYNGSDNNYLSNLYIEDVELTQDFAKDNNTYFATVDSDVDDIEIVATAEDDDAIICVYGNEDLQDGVNKVLISVTAENGNVRYYRIYVTKG